MKLVTVCVFNKGADPNETIKVSLAVSAILATNDHFYFRKVVQSQARNRRMWRQSELQRRLSVMAGMCGVNS
jgi:hypothetical protein